MPDKTTGPTAVPGDEKVLTGTPVFEVAQVSGTIKIQGRFYHVTYYFCLDGKIAITTGLGNPVLEGCKIWEIAELFRPVLDETDQETILRIPRRGE